MIPFLKKLFGGYDDNTNVSEYINYLIKNNEVVIFSKSYCPYCLKAKKIISEYKNKINKLKIIELDKLDNYKMNKIQDYLYKITGSRTVPKIYVNKKLIGGSDDLEKYNKDGKLKKLINFK